MNPDDGDPPSRRVLFGCPQVLRHLKLQFMEGLAHCATCHAESDRQGFLACSGTLTDGVEYEDVCCVVHDHIQGKEHAGHLAAERMGLDA